MSDSILMHRRLRLRASQRGVSIVELMIGMTLGLMTTLALVKSFSSSEIFSRAVTGRADAQQSGALSSWRLSRQLRLSGSGFGHGPGLWGCQLIVNRGGGQLLPAPAGWPAPFQTLPAALTLAPIAVMDNTGPDNSDQLVMMSAMSGANVVPAPLALVSGTTIETNSSTGFLAGDLLLAADASVIGPCQIGQVDNTFAPIAGLAAPTLVPTSAAGAPFNVGGSFNGLPAGGDYTLLNLGSTPIFQMIGLDDESQLMLFDPLQIYTAAAPVAMAQNVVQLQALYGVDNGAGGGVLNDNVIDEWVLPTGAWSFANVSGAAGNSLWIKAVRVAMVVRSTVPSGNLGPTEIELFSDLPAAVRTTIALGADEQRFSHQVFDLLIPLRNQSAALCSQHRREANIPVANGCQ